MFFLFLCWPYLDEIVRSTTFGAQSSETLAGSKLLQFLPPHTPPHPLPLPPNPTSLGAQVVVMHSTEAMHKGDRNAMQCNAQR